MVYPNKQRKRTTAAAIGCVLSLIVSLLVATLGLTATPVSAQEGECGAAPAGYRYISSNDRAIRGTPGNDFICAGPGPNNISGQGGDDIIFGGGGNDRIAGGKGNDIINGGAGNDQLRGGTGNDILDGGEGNDVLKGQPGADKLDGGAGDDDLRGGPGTDLVDGGENNDVVNGQGGDDEVLGGTGDDVLRGKDGDDDLIGGEGDDRANGGRGTDACDAEETVRCEPTGEPNPDPQPDPDPDPEPDPPAPDPDPEPDPEPPAPDPDPEPDPDAEMAELVSTIEDTIIATYGDSHPWIPAAWAYISTNGQVKIADLANGTAGTVNSACRFSTANLPTCEAQVFTMDRDSLSNVGVIIHELAHVYEGTLALHNNGGPFAQAQLYFHETYGAGCSYAEVMADAMLYDVDPNAFLYYWQAGCASSLPNQPTAADMAVLQAGLSGADFAWFDETYTNGADGWTAIRNAPGILTYQLITGLANEFDGYCSTSHTMQVVFGIQEDDNPFADGGC